MTALPRAGDQFRHFRALEKVGEGGMGVVYRARDTKLGRDVALKFLTGVGPLAPEHADRLRREARSLAALNHPNIVTIHDIDEVDGVPFLVLECIPGRALSDPSHAKPFGADRFLQIALPVADALAAAHERGIVHRDVKPGNVLVTDDGRTKLVDFGLAKFREGEQELTKTTAAMGTVGYMSPEQATGVEVGPASDVFSFGVMAYELLTGRRPFQRESAAAVLYAIVHEPHPPLAGCRGDLPGGLIALVDRCLEKEPRARFQNGGELLHALRRVGPGGVSAGPAEVTTHMEAGPAQRPPERRPRATQDIRFCTTADGVKIAYSLVGSGPFIVRVLGWFTHLEMEWEWPDLRLFWDRLAEAFTVVRYDGRGIGLSDRYPGPFTEDTRRLDLEAVVGALPADKVVLLGISEGGWTAASFAVDCPSRVSRLVLYGAYARGPMARPGYDAEEEHALMTLIRRGWGKDTPRFRQIFTSQFFQSDADPGLIAHFNQMQRASADPETAARYVESCHIRGDGRELFTQIRTPTLVIHCRDDRAIGFEEGRILAACIPGAQFVPLPSGSHYFPTSQKVVTALTEAIVRFVGAPPGTYQGGV